MTDDLLTIPAAVRYLALGEAGLRIGLSYGPAIRRLGDIFGATVNLASRMSDIAEPNTAVASPEIAAALRENPQFKFESLAERSITGIGWVTPFVVVSTPDEALT